MFAISLSEEHKWYSANTTSSYRVVATNGRVSRSVLVHACQPICRLGDLLCFVFVYMCAYCIFSVNCVFFVFLQYFDTVGWVLWPVKQESPAIADKPARRESLPKLLQFDVPSTLSLTILAYLHAFNCYCVRNPRNPEKFTENSNLWSSRSSTLVPIESPYVTCY